MTDQTKTPVPEVLPVFPSQNVILSARRNIINMKKRSIWFDWGYYSVVIYFLQSVCCLELVYDQTHSISWRLIVATVIDHVLRGNLLSTRLIIIRIAIVLLLNRLLDRHWKSDCHWNEISYACIELYQDALLMHLDCSLSLNADWIIW